jgi:hypothetical protein
MRTIKLFEEFVNENLITEGIHDKNILKAFFMAGGPGSGKSKAAEELFGVPEHGLQSVSYRNGLKIINSDRAFELQLNKIGVDPKDLGSVDSEKFNELTTGDDSPRGKARRITKLKQKYFLDGRLGMIIDGSGENYNKIETKKNALETYGYDCYMIFVNTSLDVALQRNAMRSRTLPEQIVKDHWQSVQNNIGHFQTLFGVENLIIVDNSVSGTEHFEKVSNVIDKLLNKQIQNRIGREWIKQNS